MADKYFPKSNLPIRRSVELLPTVFQTEANDKFLSGVLDPLVQPGVLEKVVGYVGRRYGKTYNGNDIYVDSDNTLRSRYQLEPGIIYRNHDKVENFYDYIDLKNQLKFFGNTHERDDQITEQEHYTWNPPINWDKFVNYREYYWEPSGPPSLPIYGQSATVTSTYKVTLGATSNSFIFTPDAFTNNPTLTLYRGQTYKFRIDAPSEGFAIRTNFDTGSLLYRPYQAYAAGQTAVYDNKLWQALRDISPADGSSISLDSQDWQFVENISSATILDYNKGVTNNRIEKGILTFTVPYDAPDILYYQGMITPDRYGRFLIADIESNTYLNIDKDVIGKVNFTSSNGIEFSNGMVVEFRGNVTPSKYSRDTWLVEGVGNKITLTRFSDLEVPVLTTEVPEILFDNEGFDTQPFDDASAYPTYKDYITIERDSVDLNPWSRYNRWFHRSVLEKSYSMRGQDFPASETARAKRPIIEFKSNLQLYNHGSVAKQSVDYIDTFTDDIFSKIEGSTGYNIDGEFLFDGARVLVIADTDDLANNKIYQVEFITHNNRRQIHLRETDDTDSVLNQGILIKRGTINSGLMYHFNGTNWISSQKKTTVNQAPMFDAFDENGVSFSDVDTYPVSSFVGTKILSYKTGTGRVDPELGFQISYLNIDNVGDIQFQWNWDSEEFNYTINRQVFTKKVSTGYFRFNPSDTYANGWIALSNDYAQPIIDSQVITTSTNEIVFNTIYWDKITDSTPLEINFYLNGKKINTGYSRNRDTFTFNTTFKEKDVLVIKIITTIEPDQGYYEIPLGVIKNPLNDDLDSFTLGQAVDHISTAIEFNKEFTGIVPGDSNLRDLNNYQEHAKRFLKHSGLSPLSLMLLCDKTHNVVKSIQYAKKSYTDFKNNFLKKALELNYNDSVPDFVDDIITELAKTKTVDSPFAESNMIGAGAFTKISYTVEDTGIKTFSLNEKFSLSTVNEKAVYIYINGSQLLNSSQYEFNDTFGFVSLLVDLQKGDEVEIREYLTSSSCHIPPTPSSMGLYKKYTPMKFVDDTYREPQEVIQGHDGSITLCFGDFRDDLLLELEYRIYNNIRNLYNTEVFDIDQIIGGYYGVGLYTKPEIDEIVIQEFLKWIQNTNINYTLNNYFRENETFTYTYSNMTDPTRTKNIPGWWRGVYQWFYDTDRPHRCPWEMLGFSEKPTWWESQYGPAPYTSNNLLLWEDLRDGVIRQGDRAGIYDRYKRSTLLDHIPVDGDGKLLSPLDSGLAQDFSLINNKGPFVLGDVSPVEYAWRASSEYPFALMMAMSLMRPFEFINDAFDLTKVKINKIGQTINSQTDKFITLSDIAESVNKSRTSSGLVKYLVCYVKSRGLSVDTLENKISNLDVALTTRLSGFVDQEQQKYLLDSKSPSSTSSSIFVPTENYDIIFNVSAPITSTTYSGVILEKTDSGWIATGYDDIQPYFNYYAAVPNQRDPLISVGGVSEKFLDWESQKLYNNGVLVRYSNEFFRSIKTHTSTDTFDSTLWKKIPAVPTVGSVDAYRRRSFNTLSVKRLSYGTELTNIQQVVDFLLGYEQYLKSVGFKFNRYDPENKASQDWTTSVKEFMFWTKHNWSEGSIITLSPAAEKVDITIPVGVADNILDGFYDYQILKSDGKPLTPNFININRSFQNITVETTNTTEGIYYLKLYYVLKEHVAVFDDRTVFNDIIYDKTTGYRQERIKTQGYRTTDWDGDYTSPGFLFDNVNIAVWQPFTDYRLGDIVAYKSYNWTSLVNQLGSETFDETRWSKLDSTPQKQLVPNFDYKIKEFYDFYEVTSDGISESQRELSRHTIGYQTREYLQNLSEDSVTQFMLYQGFIREKGTANSITKVFGKLSRSGSDSVILNEEWAFRVGRLGGTDQFSEIEFQLEKNKLNLNPQPLLIGTTESSIAVDQYYRLTGNDFTIATVPFTENVNPTTADENVIFSAGYVNTSQVDHIVKDRDSLLTYDINSVNENDHIWVTFDSTEWTVLRLNESPLLSISDFSRTSSTTVLLTLNRQHNLSENDIVGFRNINNLTGFYKIVAVTNDTVTSGSNPSITIEVAADVADPEIEVSTVNPLHLLTNCRFDNYQDIDPQIAALFKNNSKVFIDDAGSGTWEVVEKKKQYSAKPLLDYGISSPIRTGEKVIYDNNLKQVISSIADSGYVMCYAETSEGLQLKQIISPSTDFRPAVTGSFGDGMAISPDGKYLIIGSPLASGVPSDYVGEWTNTLNYGINNIVLYAGRLYRAVSPSSPDGSTSMAINTDDWELATLIPAYSSGPGEGYYEQGMISIYEYQSGRYQYVESFVSPRPSDNEKFGSTITIGKDGSTYYMAVSATGSYNGTGRVYLYTNPGTGWSHLENPSYRGIFDPTATYYPGDIVWQGSTDPIAEGVRGNLWQALEQTVGDSTITINSQNWLKVSDITTHCSVPSNISVEDDGSTLEFAYTGLLSDTQMAELVKQGDMFGTSMAMNQDGSILIVGAPFSDGQFYSNYRGLWRGDVEYVEGEVVRFRDPTTEDPYVYYRLTDTLVGPDSSIRSYNERPDNSSVWQQMSDSSSDPSGKVFVYKRSSYGTYELKQMINAGSLPEFSDLTSGMILTTGDEFGWAMDIDASGTTLIVSSPKSDINFQDQGAAYVFERDTTVDLEYRLVQKLESFEIYPNEYFGYSVSISPDRSKIVIGARNTPTTMPVYFDIVDQTTFDNRGTTFHQTQGHTGGVYVFDKKDQTYFLTEKLETTLSPNESFGYSVDCVGNYILVGSPNYRPPVVHASGTAYEGPFVGTVRLFKRNQDALSWETLGAQQSLVDIRKIKKVELYDNVNYIKIQDIDFIDPVKGKILNIADKEIKFKVPYDPAIYSVGTDDVVVDTGISWLEKNVGRLWWNTGTAKWVYYEQDDIAYRLGNWSQLAEGASIDVYEWVETELLPSEWAALADTNEGISLGISGQPLYPNDDVYSIKQFYSESTGNVSQTLYYYWVRSKAVTPSNLPGRTKSAAEVASLISNPLGSSVGFMAFISENQFLVYNFESIISSDTALLNIQYLNSFNKLNPIHNEYQLLTESVADSLPAQKLENKWIDSLVGSDMIGNRVPDPKLSEKQKYGIEFRPRQSMFIDRLSILKTVIININTVLTKEAFADVIDFTNLNLVDSEPDAVLNLYDTTVDTYEDLSAVGTVRIKQAILQANIIDGELDTIDIIDPGFGYRVVPSVTIDGDGTGAEAELTLDNQGRVSSVTIIKRGKKYTTLLATVRNFSVLVKSDSTINNFWSIYAWDNIRKVFFRSQAQAFDTTRYWSYIDWWKEGYSPADRIVKEVSFVVNGFDYGLEIGDLIRVKEYGAGGWAVFEKYSSVGDTFLDLYFMVGRYNGTIELDSSIYDTTVYGIGFDNTQSFDAAGYDIENAKELRNIFKAVKEDIFLGDYAVEWNNLFFTSVRYVLQEQQYVDWVFKTSFLNATHNVGSFEEKLNYKNDNLSSYQEYIHEVKPYRTTVREYLSRYDSTEPYGAAVADFDLPPTYSPTDGTVVTIDSTRTELDQYPWKWWTDNRGYSIVSIEVYDSGEQYTTAPKVLIEGSGSGAIAQAYISNGRVSGIQVINGGSGYLRSPTISLVGGNPAGATTAKAVAIIGDTKVRTFDVTMKFDRINKEGLYQNFTQEQEFTANGYTAVFELNYAPTRDKSKISILKNDRVILTNEYSISLYYDSSDTYSLLRGKIIFEEIPAAGDVIKVVYEKNDNLLDSVNRINKYYSPSTGMKGDELSQLMTGIDFGGVQIQGTTFEVTGGWDALPWFTDNWDSVESSSDYYVICDGSTISVTLPFVPAAGQKITVYLKRSGESAPVRIDDEYYNDQVDSSTSSNPNAQMPTFIGDGTNATVDLDGYIDVRAGDTLIFRPVESDGSVTITDTNLLDTAITGGTLASMSGAYSTATGTTAEEIVISGGKFVEPDHVPAPEENVPGQVLDSVSIRVFHNSLSGAAPLQSKTVISNGTSTIHSIGQKILESKSVIVYVNKVKKLLGLDYSIDLKNSNIEFGTAPAVNDIIEIISIGIGGLEILDYQEFIADGTTRLFLTDATYEYTSTIFVTVNGEYVDAGFTNSTGVVDTVGKTLIEFGFIPATDDVIKILCMKASTDVDSTGLSIIRINKQVSYFEGSTRSFDIEEFVELSRGSALASMVVEVNGQALRGVDTVYEYYDGTNNSFIVGVDPEETAGTVLPSNIKVYINGELKTFIQDYTYNGTTKELTIEPSILNENDRIRIENDIKAEYYIDGSNLVIDSSVSLISVDENDNDRIEITWFNEYPSLRMVSDEYTGGKSVYYIPSVPLSVDYVWVYKNGIRLTQDQDYYLSLPRSVLYLNVDSTHDDLIKIVAFGSNLFKMPSAFEIHKDMLNFYHYKRFCKNEVKLSKVLNYYDTQLEVTDASSLTEPIVSRNVPGAIYIKGERIEYMNKQGNVLSQLRRGCYGTAIGESYAAGSDVIDIGSNETIPYNETQDRVDFVSDGSTLLIGPLNFVPAIGSRTGAWHRSTIPNTYGPCDQIEVFAAGRRLRKDPLSVYNEDNGASSPEADIQQEAEFTVDGSTAYIRLTEPLAAGTRITVIKRVGKVWYDRGETTATTGITLLENSSAIAKFIAKKSTSLPE